jgi:polyphenol oxidase
VWFTGRGGGTSAAPYDLANLALHVGDDPSAVHANRAALAHALGAGVPDPEAWVWLDQVHGATVVVADGPRPSPSAPLAQADAAVTVRPGMPLAVLVADCAPVALVSPGAVGVVHAGWRGLEAGVVEHAVAQLRALEPGGGAVRAVIGPCIHPARYEFGAADLARLTVRFGPAVASTTEWGTPALDLPAAVTSALRGAGVDDVTDVGVCTAASPHHFSHRRDGTTGRQAVVVVRP